MEKNYIAPKIEVLEIEVEDAVLAGSRVELPGFGSGGGSMSSRRG